MVNAAMAEPDSRVRFRQPGISVEKGEEFNQLHSALQRVFSADVVPGFLRLLARKAFRFAISIACCVRSCWSRRTASWATAVKARSNGMTRFPWETRRRSASFI